jgi:hypothetical protein
MAKKLISLPFKKLSHGKSCIDDMAKAKNTLPWQILP